MTKTAYYNSIIGKLRVDYTDTHITYFKFADEDIDLNHSQPSSLSNNAIRQVSEYFEGKRTTFDLPLQMTGTDFQKNVWRELCNIPYGETRTYKQIAIAIGNPKAVRAVGLANNKNPISIIVPCHRVIGSNGKLVGYAGGLDIKRWLLQLEQRSSDLIFRK